MNDKFLLPLLLIIFVNDMVFICFANIFLPQRHEDTKLNASHSLFFRRKNSFVSSCLCGQQFLPKARFLFAPKIVFCT